MSLVAGAGRALNGTPDRTVIVSNTSEEISSVIYHLWPVPIVLPTAPQAALLSSPIARSLLSCSRWCMREVFCHVPFVAGADRALNGTVMHHLLHDRRLLLAIGDDNNAVWGAVGSTIGTGHKW